MKNIFIIIAFTITYFQFSIAQVIPPPPPNPQISSSSQSESTSVSISHTDDDYTLKASFPKNREVRLKELIQSTLGDKNLDIRKGYSKWSNDEKVYEIKLTETSLRIWLDLNIASPDLVEKFKRLGDDAKTIISGSTATVEKDRMQREADRMRREADRMQREAQRLEQQIERETKQVEREAQRIERDAKRIEREAKRLDLEAKRIEEKARHQGGVSTYIKQLLDDPKTTYTEPTGSDLNWIWPNAQKKLLQTLRSDGLIDSPDDVTFTAEKDGMYVNGKEVSETQYQTYSKMLQNAGVQSTTDFSFYKKGNRIVVIGLNARIKKVFNDLYAKGFIASPDKPVKLFIEGTSITQNGTKLATDKVAAINAILRDNGIIPAPGKYLEMKKAGSYRLGYSLGTKRIVGTWIEED